jgi:two-component system response regulator NreC
MSMEKIKIMVVDDHNVLRQALAAMINENENYVVVGEAENGRVALEKMRHVKPDIVLLDICMPILNGIDIIKHIKAILPACSIIILSMYDNSMFIRVALEHGASGYLLKDIDACELFRAMDSVHRGNIYLCDKISNKVISDYTALSREKKYTSSLEILSPREREIFQLIAEGNRGKEIAKKLNISSKTVEHHRYAIMAKLGCTNTAEIVRLAIKEGIIIP